MRACRAGRALAVSIAGHALAASACGGGRAVEVEKGVIARRAVLRSTVTASGEIVAVRYAHIGSSVMGQLVSLPVREGERVRRGQVLARIDSVPAASDAAAAAAATRAAEAEQEAAEARAEEAKKADLANVIQRHAAFVQGPRSQLAHPLTKVRRRHGFLRLALQLHELRIFGDTGFA